MLWEPSAADVAATKISMFRDWLRANGIVDVNDYNGLWRFSVDAPSEFWGAVADYLAVRWHARPNGVLTDASMPGATWFPGGTLNYAEHALTPGVAGADKGDDDLAVIFEREDGQGYTLSYGQLRAQVGAARAALAELGVGKGDRVVALVPNIPEALIAMLATASLGAIWSSCSPDFGIRAVTDRFAQVEPKVFVAVNGHVYNGRTFDTMPTVRQLGEQLSTLAATVVIDYVEKDTVDGVEDTAGFHDWKTLLDKHSGVAPEFEPVPFDHPLWVLYSSGTTGLPKGIVHGHGGITLEHLKQLALQSDIHQGTRFFWYTTTGWMMWNYLVSGLLTGATIVVYDGSPGYPDLGALWRMAQRHDVEYFGTSAPFVQSCLKDHQHPAAEYGLDTLRAVGSTGAPLSEDGFRWLMAEVGAKLQVCSVSGGTDLCTAFVGAAPDVPVWLGELSCAALGVAAKAFDPLGNEVVGEVGELVITQPAPSMPVYLWGDADGSRMREAYFDMFPGVWRHGDWVRFTERGSAVIYGRSDSTLNRGGVRMGTAEFYRVVEGFDAVADALVIDTSGAGEEGELLCFLVLASGSLADVEPLLRKELRGALSPRHVPDQFIEVAQIPRTLNGKKCEVPVKRIIAGVPAEQAVSADALANPDALGPFIELANQRGVATA